MNEALQTVLNLDEGALLRITHEGTASRDLRVRFERFHARNPGVFKALLRLAWEAKNAGHDKVGIDLLAAAARWESVVGRDPHEPWKVNNSYRAFYARLLNEEPGLEGMFETRKGTWND